MAQPLQEQGCHLLRTEANLKDSESDKDERGRLLTWEMGLLVAVDLWKFSSLSESGTSPFSHGTKDVVYDEIYTGSAILYGRVTMENCGLCRMLGCHWR